MRELYYINYGPENKVQKREVDVKYDEKGEVKSYSYLMNGADQSNTVSGLYSLSLVKDERTNADGITRTRFGTTTPAAGVATKVEQPELPRPEVFTPSKASPQKSATKGSADTKSGATDEEQKRQSEASQKFRENVPYAKQQSPPVMARMISRDAMNRRRSAFHLMSTALEVPMRRGLRGPPVQRLGRRRRRPSPF